jgi:hypothetical protein
VFTFLFYLLTAEVYATIRYQWLLVQLESYFVYGKPARLVSLPVNSLLLFLSLLQLLKKIKVFLYVKCKLPRMTLPGTPILYFTSFPELSLSSQPFITLKALLSCLYPASIFYSTSFPGLYLSIHSILILCKHPWLVFFCLAFLLCKLPWLVSIYPSFLSLQASQACIYLAVGNSKTIHVSKSRPF